MNTTYETYKNPKITLDLEKIIKEIENGKSIYSIATKKGISDITIRRRIIESIGIDKYIKLTRTKEEKKKQQILEDEKNSKKLRKKISKSKFTEQELQKFTLEEKRIKPSINMLKKLIDNPKVDINTSEKLIILIHTILYNKNKPRGNNVVCSAAVYTQSYGKRRKNSVTQEEAADYFGITTPTVRDLFKTIKKKPTELLDLI